MSEICNRYLMLAGVILLALFAASTGIAQVSPATGGNIKNIADDIKPYEGSTGPDSVFYGLKITMENMGEFFTFNETEKVKKQMENAELRIAEAKTELNKKNTEAMNRALEQYREKIKSTDNSISGTSGVKPELLAFQERIIKHELVLRNLSQAQPGNIGLETALNNSMRLEEKFELRTRVKLEREIGDDRRMVRVREIQIEEKEIETEIENNAVKVKVKVKFIADGADRNAIEKEIIEKIKLGRDDISKLLNEAEVSGTSTATPTSTGTPSAPGTERTQDELKVRVDSGKSVSEVEVEFRFVLNTANRDEIINGIAQKLSTLKVDDLKKVEIEFKDRRDDRRDDRQQDRQQDRRQDRGAPEPGDDKGGARGGDTSGRSGSDDSSGSSGGSGGGGGGSSK